MALGATNHPPARIPARDGLSAAVIFVALLLVYNANGREIGSFDSQPTKFAARELLARGTLSLNAVVEATPEYANRWGFILAPDGTYRSVYSPVPAMLAAGLTWPFRRAGLIDTGAPLAPALMAKATASILVAAAVALGFLTARQSLSRRQAGLVAMGLGLGTGLWSTASQTLWQTETAVFGLALAVVAFARGAPISGGGATLIGLGLGLMGAARPQLAPVALILLCGSWVLAPRRNAVLATVIVVLFGSLLCVANLRWFGHPLGAQPLLQSVNAKLHATSGSMFSLQFDGLAGLLISPSRGLFIFSPITLLAVAATVKAFAAGWRSPLRWCVIALAAQFALYGSYSVWWGGHTYGPRYLLDVLPLTVPLAAAALAQFHFSAMVRTAWFLALAWSIAVSATGAFCYPHERWNIDPVDVDRQHYRLWAVSDSQIPRCWQRGLSPQNFRLFNRAAIRK